MEQAIGTELVQAFVAVRSCEEQIAAKKSQEEQIQALYAKY